MESLACLKCGGPLSDKDLNTEVGIAKCKYCDAWMKIEDIKKQPEPLTKEERQIEIPIPSNVQIEQLRDTLTITVNPGANSDGVLTVVSILGGIAAVLFLIFFGSVARNIGAPPICILAPLLMMLIVAGSILFGIAKSNSQIRERNIKVIKDQGLRYQPQGYGGKPLLIRLNRIKQFYSTEEHDQKYVHSNKPYGATTFYNVYALMTDNSTRPVMTGLQSKQEAIVVERKLEEFLGMPDIPVAGEIG
ncbi:hypothetical protein [Polystyrenella longa]|uniref:hypothetical protein n=1 Tax=Polystyrenella longa TaxID=2528007 RepID=UPI0011A4211F|nr:hypothetical protein [Polystyrenella longa]